MKKTDFNFEFAGYGHYKVIYTSPKTLKTWERTTSDMRLIDLTKNEETPKQKDLKQLKDFCKGTGW